MTDDGFVEVPVVWMGAEDLPATFVNQFLCQISEEGEVFLTLGTLIPPPLTGDSPEELRRQAAQLSVVGIRTVVRVATSPERLAQFIPLLQGLLDHHEAKNRQGKEDS